MSKKSTGINTDLERAVNDMLKQSINDPDIELELKLKILDRAINLEKIKLKINDDNWGSGFLDEDDAK
jgi:hypothetical protein